MSESQRTDNNEKCKFTYFVSFFCQGVGCNGYGNGVFDTNFELDCEKNIRALEAHIMQSSKVSQLSIISFQKL